ncbi:Phospholipase ABHD3 [Fragariocoptes setiger]|uniref:Phospholipase ABHD3 n=1 Tax=Fragariocoptes setiger TaxID=1670756 RepID=A0ABQ7S6D0_9ACAR|nr:Phospholipase ABHD3 [Fragariocoptes setiger]
MMNFVLSTPGWFLDSLPNGTFGDIFTSVHKCVGTFYEANPATSVFLFFFMLYYVYYVKNVVKKPDLVCGGDKFRNFLLSNCPIIDQEYRPTLWCAQTHAQTLMANGIRAVIPIPKYIREYVEVCPDIPPRKGSTTIPSEVCNTAKSATTTEPSSEVARPDLCDPPRAHVTIDWYDGPGQTFHIHAGDKYYSEVISDDNPSARSRIQDDGRPIAILFPGLVGDSQTEYIRSLVPVAHMLGYKTCVFNNRSRGGTRLASPRLFCATNFDDVETVLKRLKRDHSKSRIVGIGISLGGIILCRYLATRGEKALVDAAMLVSVCFDFMEGCKSLEQPGLNSALNQHLTRTLIRVVQENKEVLAPYYDIEQISNTKYLREFDSAFTRKMWGYEHVDDYHRDASNKDRLHLIRKPTLCVNAADDMFAPHSAPYFALPVEQIKNNPSMAMIITARGGHIGFMEGNIGLPTNFFLERLLGQYLDALNNVTDLTDIISPTSADVSSMMAVNDG